MNDLIINSKFGMTSRELAKYFGKRHSDVLRDIGQDLETLAIALHDSQSFFTLAVFLDKQGKERPEYNLSKQGVLLMAARYDTVMRAKLIQHIVMLEAKVLEQQKKLYDQQEKLYQRDTERMREIVNENHALNKRKKRKTTAWERVGL